MKHASQTPSVPLPPTTALSAWSDFTSLPEDILALLAQVESTASAKSLNLSEFIPTLNRNFLTGLSSGSGGFVRNGLAQRLIVALLLLNQVEIE